MTNYDTVDAAMCETTDKIEGLEADLDSALDVLWRRGDERAHLCAGARNRRKACTTQQRPNSPPSAPSATPSRRNFVK